MGVSTSPAQLARKLERYGDEIAKANEEAVLAAAQAVKTATLPFVARATGGDYRLSGRNRSRIGVGYDLTRRGQDAEVRVAARPGGLAAWVEFGTKPHAVTSKYAPGRSRKARAALVESGDATGKGWGPRAVISFGGRTVRYARQSGGSKAKHPFRDGFRAGAEVSPKAYAEAQRRAMLSVFR